VSSYKKCEIADAPTGGNEKTIQCIERLIDAGRPLPRFVGSDVYYYADDYYRHKNNAPLRKRAVGVYYLNGDWYPAERTLPYCCDPLVQCDDGYRVVLVDDGSTKRSRRRS
jgi:hypothetical protein